MYIIKDNGLKQLISDCTITTKESKTIIDYVIRSIKSLVQTLAIQIKYRTMK